MLESLVRKSKPAELFTDEELPGLCAAFDDQLEECKRAAAGAVAFIEGYTHRSMMRQSWVAVYSDWPADGVELLRGPVYEITSVVIRSGGQEISLTDGTDYRKAAHVDPAQLLCLGSLPALDCVSDAVVICYETGHDSLCDVEDELVEAAQQLTKHFFEHPGDADPKFLYSIKHFIRHLRVPNLHG